MMAKSETRITRFQDGPGWEGVEREVYKSSQEEGRDWQGIVRQVLVGKGGESTAFHLRYFEVAPGGYSSLEKHEHAHVVVVVKGKGRAILDATAYELNPFDTVYVAPWTPHQFQAVNDEPFGFFCIVDAKRDRPQTVSSTEAIAAHTAGAFSRS
jgi:quercetin dioxygenase-like cupin family protein